MDPWLKFVNILSAWLKAVMLQVCKAIMGGTERKNEKMHNQDVAQLCYRISLLNNEIDKHEHNKRQYDVIDIDDELSKLSVERFSSAILALKSGIHLNDVVEMYELNHTEMELMQTKYSVAGGYDTAHANGLQDSD